MHGDGRKRKGSGDKEIKYFVHQKTRYLVKQGVGETQAFSIENPVNTAIYRRGENICKPCTTLNRELSLTEN